MRDWAAEVRARLARRRRRPSAREMSSTRSATTSPTCTEPRCFGASPVDEADRDRRMRVRPTSPPIAKAISAADVRRSIPRPRTTRRSGLACHAMSLTRWRVVGAKRAHSTLVVVTLAVAIGSCTAVFSLFNSLILGRAAVSGSRTSRAALGNGCGRSRRRNLSSLQPNYQDWVTGNAQLRQPSASGNTTPSTCRRRSTRSRFPACAHPPRCSRVLGVQPALGRVFTTTEDEPGHRVAVISDAIWKVHFAADPAGHRTGGTAERQRPRSHRRHADGVRVPSQRHWRLGPDSVHRAGSESRLALLLRRGTAGRGRHVRSSARRGRATRGFSSKPIRRQRRRERNRRANEGVRALEHAPHPDRALGSGRARPPHRVHQRRRASGGARAGATS